MDMSINSTDRRRLIERFKRLKCAWSQHVLQSLKPYGVVPNQSAFLRGLHALGPSSLTEIASHTHIDPAATVRLADSLTERGWVKRLEDPTDRRRWRVCLTASGAALAKKLDVQYDRNLSLLLAPLDARELAHFQRILETLLEPFAVPKAPAPTSAKGKRHDA